MKQNSGLAHCCHHDQHWEFCYDYRERVAYIKNWKPWNQVALRLHLFKLIPDKKLPGKDSPEWKAYLDAEQVARKAWQASETAGQAYNKAWQAYDKACHAYKTAEQAYLDKYADELQELHDKLFPDCPWNGETIFNQQNSPMLASG